MLIYTEYRQAFGLTFEFEFEFGIECECGVGFNSTQALPAVSPKELEFIAHFADVADKGMRR